MKKLLIFALALCLVSCSSESCEDFQQQEQPVENVENYDVMYNFLHDMVESEVFEDLGLTMPENPTYDDLMYICAPLVMSVQFGDTFAEGDCEKEYRLMLSYFEIHDPLAEITGFLRYIIDNEMY